MRKYDEISSCRSVKIWLGAETNYHANSTKKQQNDCYLSNRFHILTSFQTPKFAEKQK